MPSPTPAIASAAPLRPKLADPSAGMCVLGVPLSRYLAFLSIAGVGLGIDLWTKYAVFAWRGMPRIGNEWWIWENVFGVETALNPGALFGMGQGRSALFSVLSILALIGICYWLFLGKAARDWLLTIALSMISGGI